MKLIDFEYDGIRLSSLKCMICFFDSTEDTITIGGDMIWHTVKPPKADRLRMTGYEYEGSLIKSFSITKNPCETEEEVFNEDEADQIVSWLNRTGYHKFVPIYDDGSFTDTFYNATFNVSIVKGMGKIVGFTLDMETDSPYGYKEAITFTGNKKVEFDNPSSLLYPTLCDIEISVKEAGELIIKNSAVPDNEIRIQNCQAGEILTLKGETKIITSSINHLKLYNDFNYNFLKVGRTLHNKRNIITSNLNADIKVIFCPAQRVGLII